MVSTMDDKSRFTPKEASREVTRTRLKKLAPKIVCHGSPEEFHVDSKVVHLETFDVGTVTRVIRKGPVTTVYWHYDDSPEPQQTILGHGYRESDIGILLEPDEH